jgi:hypothetical protein
MDIDIRVVLRCLGVVLAMLAVVGLIAFARGVVHHHGQQVGHSAGVTAAALPAAA